MGWPEGLVINPSSRAVKMSASGASSGSACGLHMALKAHPDIAIRGWRYTQDWDHVPSPLKVIRGVVRSALALDPLPEPAEMSRWVAAEVARRDEHRLLRKFLSHAAENILDTHFSIEDEIGRLRFLGSDPVYRPTGDGRLSAWADVFTTTDGSLREIRRIRLGPARPETNTLDIHWDTVAAYIASVTYMDHGEPEYIRVVEIGAVDGSVEVRPRQTRDEVISRYRDLTRPRILELINARHVVPCYQCGECKAAGVCDALIPLPGMLGLEGVGVKSRSVSPTELDIYKRCPGQWLLKSELHLPEDHYGSGSLQRGQDVHTWLKRAHERDIACTLANFEKLIDNAAQGGNEFSADRFDAIRPFLVQHIAHCPLSDPAVTVLGVEELICGFDGDADVVPVMRPDLVYSQSGKVIIRETKTVESLELMTREGAYEKYFQIAFAVQLLRSGLARHHGADQAAVELEVLGPDDAQIWTWDANDQMTAAISAGEVRRAAEKWHEDTTWATTPGPHCAWCPVRQWCPDSDAAVLGEHGGSANLIPPF